MTEPPILWRKVKCGRCRDTYWVCETHDDVPWDGEHACGCGAAGKPCPNCNPSDKDARREASSATTARTTID